MAGGWYVAVAAMAGAAVSWRWSVHVCRVRCRPILAGGSSLAAPSLCA